MSAAVIASEVFSVAPIVWERGDNPNDLTLYGKTVFGMIYIRPAEKSWEHGFGFGPSQMVGPFESVEAMKADAERFYRERLAPALVPVKTVACD